MKPREFHAALPREVTVAQAQGVLAALLDVSIADAATSLELKAQFSRLSLEGAARQVLDDHQRRVKVDAPTEIDGRALAILRYHVNTPRPHDAPSS